MQLAIVLTPDLDNPDEGDLRLTNGQSTLTSTLIEEVAQTLHTRFAWWRGEWFLDEAQGTPWLEAIVGAKYDERALAQVFSQIVRTTPGVAAVDSLTVSIDHKTREASVVFVARLRDGAVLTSSDFGPYLVQV